jgi:hypothetical protein
MRNLRWDQPKTTGQLKKELGKVCKIDGCSNPLTQMKGPGSGVLCREHQIYQREYGEPGRIDRPHTFHRTWSCESCGYNPLEDPRLADIEDEMIKRTVGRVLMHGDHNKIRRADGGDDSADNIKCLCYACHAKKTILERDHIKNKNVQ